MNRLKLNLNRKASLSYEIHIGTEIMDRMAMLLVKHAWAARYVIVTDTQIDALHGARVQAVLEKADLRVERVVVAPGEASKGMQTAMEIVSRLTALSADRTTALIALGGGVIGDLTGFVGSIYMRGIPVIQVPTTLLAQVDSGIGGKTAVDTDAGKNLIGTFSQPRAVFIDLAFLRTLPDDQFRSGLAEVIKYGVIESPELLDDLDAAAANGSLKDPAFLERIVTAACRIKKGFVELDEKDRGLRRMLNFGHTVGHAVEAASGYALSHGEAVAIGMVAAADLSERRHGLAEKDRRRIASVVRALGLPDRIPADLDPGEICTLLKRDKKKEGEKIHFVLLKKLGVPFLNGGVPEEVVTACLEGLKR
jgi:3-dehydroquinate synthase